MAARATNSRAKKAAESAGTSVARRVQRRVGHQNAYVPHESIGQSYQPRKIDGIQDMRILEKAQDEALNVMLKGDTGAGKTMLGEAYAALTKQPYYSVPCEISLEPSALFGKMMPGQRAGEFEWVDGPVTELVRHGGVLNISEVNMMSQKIVPALYPLLDARRYIVLLNNRGEVVRAHRPENCWCDLPVGKCNAKLLLIVADMNPNYRGTQQLNAAFSNRFPIKINWGYERDIEAKLISTRSILEIADKLRAMAGTEIRTPVSTNSLMMLEKVGSDPEFGLGFAIGNFLAGFEPAEADAVSKVVDLYRPRMATELGALRMKKAAESAGAEIDGDEIDLTDDDDWVSDWIAEDESL